VDITLIRHHVENFWAAYTDAVDRRDYQALVDVIGAGTVVSHPSGASADRAGIAAWYSAVLPPEPNGYHLIHNPRIAYPASDAAVAADCRYTFVGGNPLRPQVLGRYRTTFRVAGDRLDLAQHRLIREFESAPDATFTAQ
jgi:hypothetical protein